MSPSEHWYYRRVGGERSAAVLEALRRQARRPRSRAPAAKGTTRPARPVEDPEPFEEDDQDDEDASVDLGDAVGLDDERAELVDRLTYAGLSLDAAWWLADWAVDPDVPQAAEVVALILGE